MNEDTKLSDLTVAEFRKIMQECLQIDMDATKEVEKLRQEFINNSVFDQITSNPYPSR